MKKAIKVLDCTLRDGGRCFGSAWGDIVIKDISKKLVLANIDIIEIGFLWYSAEGICRENTTLFNSIEEISEFISGETEFVAYIEFVLFKRENREIPYRKLQYLNGIRLGILKEELYESIPTMKDIKNKGYKLYLQGINALSYTETEIKELCQVLNEIKPYAFAIVDTYGAMYPKDLIKVYKWVDKYLDKDIAIDFHSHNNIQMSLALAITLIEIANNREIIIDSTLCGIGMGAGNLSTEMLVKYLIEEYNMNYNMNIIMKLIDMYINKFKDKYSWDSSILTYEAACNWTAQINTSYIINEYKNETLLMKRKLLGMCPVAQGIGKHTIDDNYRLINEYCADSKDNMEIIKDKINFDNILILAQGPSIIEKKNEIDNFIKDNELNLLIVNPKDNRLFNNLSLKPLCFFNNENSYSKFIKENSNVEIIKVFGQGDFGYCINQDDIILEDNFVANNSTIMVFDLITKLFSGKNIYVAGFDGTDANMKQIFVFKKHLEFLKKKNNIYFLTKSLYE